MPTYRLTLKSNANQSIKSPVIFSPNPSQDPFVSLKAQAKSKLRLKKPTRWFLPGGKELHSADDLLDALSQDLTILVSSGEEYVGSTATTAPTKDVTILASKSDVESQAISQLKACTALPGIVAAVGLPDLHPGDRFPIGCAFVSDGYIHPPLIGGDIGCGMAYYRLPSLSLSNLERTAQALTGLEGPWEDAEARSTWLGDASSGNARIDESIGTIGAGNHFAEIQVVEKSPFPDIVKEGDVLLLVHSGSRGFGKSVLEKFYKSEQKDEGVSLSADSDQAKEYLAVHDKACAWGKKNRDLIAARFLNKLEPGSTWTGATIAGRRIGDVVHNCVVPTQWPPGEQAETQTYYLHRKGAAPTVSSPTYNTLPFLPLPGSRGTPTLLLQPLFTESNQHGAYSALSSAHGAGRAMSRGKAKDRFSKKDEPKQKKGHRKGDGANDDFFAGGGGAGSGSKKKKADGAEEGWVICDDKELFYEEFPGAYKDVECVAADLVDSGVVGGEWAVCRPRITYKLRRER